MSEPSPGGKQAAEFWWFGEEGHVINSVTCRHAYAKGYDTATAKLREELAIARKDERRQIVEKFKREAERTYGGNTFAAQVYEAGCHYGAAQARAPLVEALEAIRATGGSSVCVRAWHRCLEIADAALTGTGECPNCGRDLDKCHGNCIFSKDGTQNSNVPPR